jgi:hypothetical protein
MSDRLSNPRWGNAPAPPLIDCTPLAAVDPGDMAGFVRAMLGLMAGRPVVMAEWGSVYYEAEFLDLARQLGVSVEGEKIAA